MDWRRWDNLKMQSALLLADTFNEIESIAEAKQDYEMSKVMPNTKEATIERPTNESLDPFRNDTSGRARKLHRLRYQRAVIP